MATKIFFQGDFPTGEVPESALWPATRKCRSRAENGGLFPPVRAEVRKWIRREAGEGIHGDQPSWSSSQEATSSKVL